MSEERGEYKTNGEVDETMTYDEILIGIIEMCIEEHRKQKLITCLPIFTCRSNCWCWDIERAIEEYKDNKEAEKAGKRDSLY